MTKYLKKMLNYLFRFEDAIRKIDVALIIFFFGN